MKHIKRVAIYKMTSPTGKIYIGQTRDIINRKSRYKTLTCKNQSKLYRSLIKYGFEILQFLPSDIAQSDLNNYEIFCLENFKEAGYELLNLKDGGSYGLHPIESRIKNSKSHMGKIPWNKGKRGSQIAWNKGINLSRKSYIVMYCGNKIEIFDLKKYCKENNLSYGTMMTFYHARKFYKNKNYYKSYSRVIL
jgi:hypothetical protein